MVHTACNQLEIGCSIERGLVRIAKFGRNHLEQTSRYGRSSSKGQIVRRAHSVEHRHNFNA